eukprot:Selendium_serpulae@DN4818_c0_g1_i1.p1
MSIDDGGTVFPWLWLFIAFTAVVSVFEQYLNSRQLRKYKIEDLPDNIKALKIATQDDFAKSQHYSRDKMSFKIFNSILDFLIQTVVLIFFVLPSLWNFVSRYTGTNEYWQSLGFMFAAMLVSEIQSVPVSLYFDFVIEERHGFNKKTLKLFFMDEIKTFIISCVIGGPTLCAIIAIIKWGGSRFYLYLWSFSILLIIVMMIIYPNFIAPLFNKYEALKDTELKTKIETLAGELNFPLTKLYQMDGSTRSSHSNAYFYGFWKWKRIVLFDTLLDASHDQILAILGHELGHWKLNHMPKMLAVSCAHMFINFYLYGTAMATDSLYESFGFADTRACIIGLTLFLMIYAPVDKVVEVFITLMTRRNEFEADEFAVKLGFAAPLASGLVFISKKSLAALCVDPWYAWYHYTHPHLVERLNAIKSADERRSSSSPSAGTSSKAHPLIDGKPSAALSREEADASKDPERRMEEETKKVK